MTNVSEKTMSNLLYLDCGVGDLPCLGDEEARFFPLDGSGGGDGDDDVEDDEEPERGSLAGE